MPTFDTWDVSKARFPYTDRPVRERHPALVIADETLEEQQGMVLCPRPTGLRSGN